MRQLIKPFIPNRFRRLIQRRYQSVHYGGSNVACPCCGGQFRTFLPGGVNQRPNARCPQCRSLERHRLMWLYLKQETDLFRGNITFLHFAPEKFFQNKFKAIPSLQYYSADLMSPFAETHVDITSLCYKDESFEAVLCSHVLEHVLNDRQAMCELLRVLKPRGWAILQTPIDNGRPTTFEDETIVTPEDRTRVFGQYNHVRIYGRDYKDRLQQAGFKVRVDDYVKRLEPEAVKRYGLDGTEDIYFCTRPL